MILSENKNVAKVTSKSITYTDAFKLKAINEYALGVEYVINRYINYYNTNRSQWKLKKMTPEKYRNHLLEVA